jgi:hypothetical protein
MEQCVNCERGIGKLETAYVYADHVVCFECKQRLDLEVKDTGERAGRAASDRANGILDQLGLTQLERQYAQELCRELFEYLKTTGTYEDVLANRATVKSICAAFAYCLASIDEIHQVFAQQYGYE